jgi:hypothetical protein
MQTRLVASGGKPSWFSLGKTLSASPDVAPRAALPTKAAVAAAPSRQLLRSGDSKGPRRSSLIIIYTLGVAGKSANRTVASGYVGPGSSIYARRWLVGGHACQPTTKTLSGWRSSSGNLSASPLWLRR